MTERQEEKETEGGTGREEERKGKEEMKVHIQGSQCDGNTYTDTKCEKITKSNRKTSKETKQTTREHPRLFLFQYMADPVIDLRTNANGTCPNKMRPRFESPDSTHPSNG